MLGEGGVVLYVGKAKDLKKRVTSYFRGQQAPKTHALVQQIHNITITITTTENEALLLENNLIKELKPRYNVLLRDDKSYPYIYLSADKDFPRLDFHRGPKRLKGRYFGPFLSSSAVRESLTLLQKLFKIRSCNDNFFQNRTRPCLQYQIKRCSAPCVNYIDPATYQHDIRHAELFLEGKNEQVIDELVQRMQAAAKDQKYELAAHFRDQIVQLRHVQEQQFVTRHAGDIDIIAVATQHHMICVAVLSMRSGRLLGNKSFFPQAQLDFNLEEILTSFISQYYLHEAHRHDIPKQIVVSCDLEEGEWLAAALSEVAGHRVEISTRSRSEKLQWLKMAQDNATHALQTRLADKSSMAQRMTALQEAFGLENAPRRMECFDISHSSGEATVASCVVFSEEGPLKSDYRRFNIEGITAGDDYAAMHQALQRRYMKLKTGEGKLPDILFIDGGKGQLTQAEKVFEELQISGVFLVSIAKGPERKAGLEVLHVSGREQPLVLAPDSDALHLIQHIRDEAHRFAITGHRNRRDKARHTSALEGIPGVGPKKRRELLHHLGGLQEVKRARIEELMKVPGISRALAQKIYDVFHEVD